MLKHFKRAVSMLLLVCVLCLAYDGNTGKVEAAVAFQEPEAFKNIQGDGKFIGNAYYYRLDIEKTGITEGMCVLLNNIANILFSMGKMIANAAIYIFYQCMNFDASVLLGDQINAIQELLHDSIFLPFLTVALIVVSFKLIGRLLRRNFVGVLTDFMSVVIVMLMSLLVVYHSGDILSGATGISKAISLDAMTSINDATKGEGEAASDTEQFAANAAGVLWENMVHNPWKDLEFGEQYDAELAEELMSQPNIDERIKIVTDSKLACFAKDKGIGRIASLAFYFIPLIIKSIIYLMLAAVQLFFQLMAVFFVLLAPVILALSIFPGYGSMVIETWLRKILEFELGIVVSTMMIAFLVYLDNSMFKATEYGWLMCYLMQIIVAASLYFGRKHIFGLFEKVQQAAQSPAYVNAMLRRSGNTNQIRQSGKTAVSTVGKATVSAAASLKDGTSHMAHSAKLAKEENDNRRAMKAVAKNGGTAAGLSDNIQERAYDLTMATERRKQEKEQADYEIKKEKRAEKNRNDRHLKAAKSYWNGDSKDDEKIIEFSERKERPRTKAAREAAAAAQSGEKRPSAAPGAVTRGMSGNTPAAAGHHDTAAADKSRPPRPSDKENKETKKGNRAHAAGGETSRPRAEKKVSQAVFSTPGIKVRESQKHKAARPRTRIAKKQQKAAGKENG